MSINIGDNFKYLGKKFLDNRESFNTLAEMIQCTDVPEGFVTFCKEDRKRYEYSELVDEDPITGKWREFKVGTDINEEIVQDIVKNYFENNIGDFIQDYMNNYFENDGGDIVQNIIENYFQNNINDFVEEIVKNYFEESVNEIVQEMVKEYFESNLTEFIKNYMDNYFEECFGDIINNLDRDCAYVGEDEPEDDSKIWFDPTSGENNNEELQPNNPIIDELFACIRTLQNQVAKLQADVEYLKLNGGGIPPQEPDGDDSDEISDAFVLEDGNFFLLEDGGYMILENAIEVINESVMLLENGAQILLENGANIMLENQ
jgi:hypothetical protein